MAQTTEVKTNERAMRVVRALSVNQRTLEGLIDRLTSGFALLLASAGAALMLLIILAKRSGCFAREAGDGVVHEAPKVVAKT